MRIWIDDVRTIPENWYVWDKWRKSVNEAKKLIEEVERLFGCNEIELISLDHDAGEYADKGGDYIKLLDWLEETGRNYPIHIHSMNPVGIANMRAIIERNGWEEVK